MGTLIPTVRSPMLTTQRASPARKKSPSFFNHLSIVPIFVSMREGRRNWCTPGGREGTTEQFREGCLPYPRKREIFRRYVIDAEPTKFLRTMLSFDRPLIRRNRSTMYYIQDRSHNREITSLLVRGNWSPKLLSPYPIVGFMEFV